MILDLSEFFSDIYAIDFGVTIPVFRGFRMFQEVDLKNATLTTQVFRREKHQKIQTHYLFFLSFFFFNHKILCASF